MADNTDDTKPGKRKQTPFRLTPSAHKKLKDEADRLGLSMNGAMNVLIERHLPFKEAQAAALVLSPIEVKFNPSDIDDDDTPLQWK